MITSVHNPKIKLLRALQSQAKQRREAGAFVVEGVRLAEEALKAKWPVQLAIYTAELAAMHMGLVKALEQAGETLEVSPEVMKAASDTQSPQGVVLQLAAVAPSAPEALDFVLILDAVADPGNLGTLLRSAAAAGCQLVWLSPGCTDAWAPKVVRSGMGAHFRVPVQALDWAQMAEQIKAHHLAVYVAEASGEQTVYEQDLSQPCALILGSEAHGAGKGAANLQPTTVRIPMPGGSESLNVAAAGSILLFEVVRQRQPGAQQ